MTYTMLASASPIDTLLSVALAFSSLDAGETLTPALANDSAAYFPHGTWSAHSTTRRPDFWRSARLLIFFGLPFSTAISRRFLANTTGGGVTVPASIVFWRLSASADANTSAGAPWLICVARFDDAS